MKYLTLYRKYRPNKFSKIIGQEQTVIALQNAIINNKISHAYLFCGPRGIGKTSLAKIFAKTINCLEIQNGEACNECEICLNFNENQAIDFFEIDGASNNGIDEIRSLKEKINLAPTYCKYKVYVIDEVHMLTINAFNALLKTLEEPPKHAIFIFATTEVYKIPLTIISRCQKFDLRRISKKQIMSNLEDILQKETIPYEEEALEQIALLGDGAMRDALSILEQVIAYNQSNISLENIKFLFAIPSKAEKIGFLLNIINNESLKILEKSNHFFYLGVDLNNLMISFINICKDAIIYKTTDNSELLTILDTEDANLFNNIGQNQLLTIINNYFEAINNQNFNNNSKMYFEIATLKTMNFFDTVEQHEKKPLEIKNSSKSQFNEDILEEQEELSEKFDNKIIIPENEDNKQEEIIEKEEIVQESIQIINKPYIWTAKDYFNIIIQADKYLRMEYSNKWDTIDRYINHEKHHKMAKMLLDTKIVAATKKAFILSCPAVKQAILINNYIFTKNMQDFIEEVLQETKVVIMAIYSDELPHIRQEYYQLRIANKLEPPKVIDFDNYYVKEEDLDVKESVLNSTTYQVVQELFDNIILIE